MPKLSWKIWLFIVLLGLLVISIITYATRSISSSTKSTGSQNNLSVVLAPTVQWPEKIGDSLVWIDDLTINRLSLTTPNAKTEIVVVLPSKPSDVIWSPTGSAALVKLGEEPPIWNFVPFPEGKNQPLNFAISSPGWSNKGDRILYAFSGPDHISITTAQPDGTQWKTLFNTTDMLQQIWWPGDGAYAIGYDLASNPPQYVRIFVSSQKLEPITRTYITGALLKASPDGLKALLDTGDDTAPTISITSLVPGTVQPIGSGRVRLSSWENNQSILSVSDDGKLVRTNTQTNKTESLGLLQDIKALIAVIQGSIIYTTTNNELRSIPLDKVK